MHLLIASPLFPPETGPSAIYTQRLATHLSQKGHTVVVVAYAHHTLPLSHIRIVRVEKSLLAPLRMIIFFFALLRESRFADHIIAEKGTVAGFPATLVGVLRSLPVSIHLPYFETETHTKKKMGWVLGKAKKQMFFFMELFSLSHASRILVHSATHQRECVLRGIPIARTIVTPPPEEEPLFIPKEVENTYPLRDITILLPEDTLSLSPQTLEALSKIKEERENLSIVILYTTHTSHTEAPLPHTLSTHVIYKHHTSRAESACIIRHTHLTLIPEYSPHISTLLAHYKDSAPFLLLPTASVDKQIKEALPHLITFKKNTLSLTNALRFALSKKATVPKRKKENPFSLHAQEEALIGNIFS